MIEKRRLLRQIGLRQADLGSVGQALLLNWARAAGALHLLDEYAQREGWLDAAGDPRAFSGLLAAGCSGRDRPARLLLARVLDPAGTPRAGAFPALSHLPGFRVAMRVSVVTPTQTVGGRRKDAEGSQSNGRAALQGPRPGMEGESSHA